MSQQHGKYSVAINIAALNRDVSYQGQYETAAELSQALREFADAVDAEVPEKSDLPTAMLTTTLAKGKRKRG